MASNRASAGRAARSPVIRLAEKLPEALFVEHATTLQLFLSYTDGSPWDSSFGVSVTATLLSAGNRQPFKNQTVMKITDGGTTFDRHGALAISLSFASNSLTRGEKFLIQFKANRDEIPAVATTPFIIVKHQLVLATQPPDVWFKDEGGRDKCIELEVHLVDAKRQKVTSREVPLRVTLVYENSGLVANQDILKLSQECKRSIEKGQYSTVLKMRIEDVSKNHQGQRFRIRVDPDTGNLPLLFDVGGVASTSISVKSKRNKRKLPSSDYQSPDSSQVRRMSSSPAEGSRSSGVSSYAVTATPFQQAARPDIQLSSQPALTEACNGILSWAKRVVETLDAVQWQLYGYEVNPDNTPDESRRIYRCPSCKRIKDATTERTAEHSKNCEIAQVLVMYGHETMLHLNTLLTALDGRQVVTSSSPQETDDAFHSGRGHGDGLESRIRHIHVKMWNSKKHNGVVGFPTFDHASELVGFYFAAKESEDTDASLIFIPVAELFLERDPDDKREILDMGVSFLQDITEGNGSVLSISATHNLEDIKALLKSQAVTMPSPRN